MSLTTSESRILQNTLAKCTKTADATEELLRKIAEGGNVTDLDAGIALHAGVMATEDQLGHVKIDGETIILNEDGAIKANFESEATVHKAGLFSAADKLKLDEIAPHAEPNVIDGVKGSAEEAYRVGKVSISPRDLGLENVDNTPDSTKHVDCADKLAKAVNIKLEGAATSTEAPFDGSSNVVINVTDIDADKISSGVIPEKFGGTGVSSLENLKVYKDSKGNVITETYATKEEIENKIREAIQSGALNPSDYVTEEEFESLDQLVHTIADIVLKEGFSGSGGGNVDLSNYVTKDTLNYYATKDSLKDYAEEKELANYVTHNELDDALSGFSPSVAPTVSPSIDLSNYSTKTETISKLEINGNELVYSNAADSVMGSVTLPSSGGGGGSTEHCSTADKLAKERQIALSDFSNHNVGISASFDGSKDAVLVMPEKFEGTLIGNADSATTARKDANGLIIHENYQKIGSIDIYVSPLGDNLNNGLSPEKPVKYLSVALEIGSKYSDHTIIHLAGGHYEETAKIWLKKNSYISFVLEGDVFFDKLEGLEIQKGYLIIETRNFNLDMVYTWPTVENGEAVTKYFKLNQYVSSRLTIKTGLDDTVGINTNKNIIKIATFEPGDHAEIVVGANTTFAVLNSGITLDGSSWMTVNGTVIVSGGNFNVKTNSAIIVNTSGTLTCTYLIHPYYNALLLAYGKVTAARLVASHNSHIRIDSNSVVTLTGTLENKNTNVPFALRQSSCLLRGTLKITNSDLMNEVSHAIWIRDHSSFTCETSSVANVPALSINGTFKHSTIRSVTLSGVFLEALKTRNSLTGKVKTAKRFSVDYNSYITTGGAGYEFIPGTGTKTLEACGIIGKHGSNFYS